MKVFLCDLHCFVSFFLGTGGQLALRAVCLLFDVWGDMLASSLSILCFWASFIVFFLLTENKLEWNCDRLSFASALAVCTMNRGLEVSLSCFPGSEGGVSSLVIKHRAVTLEIMESEHGVAFQGLFPLGGFGGPIGTGCCLHGSAAQGAWANFTALAACTAATVFSCAAMALSLAAWSAPLSSHNCIAPSTAWHPRSWQVTAACSSCRVCSFSQIFFSAW